jgi:hypothetical protein
MRWNVATDYAINNMVNESFPLPKGSLVDPKYYGMSAEDIYEQLPKSKEKQGWCEKDGWEGQEQKKRGNKPGLLDKIFKKKVKKISRDSRERSKNKWEETFERDLLRNYGKLSDSMLEQLVEAIIFQLLTGHLLLQVYYRKT